MRRRHFLAAAVGMAIVAAGPSAMAQSDTALLLERARLVLLAMQANEKAAPNVRAYIQGARAVLIVPNQLKLGFILGGGHGRGVLLAHDAASGSWSEPAIFDLYSGSIGLQFGGQSSDAIYTIMNQAALDKLLAASSFKMGGDASVALGEGAGIGAATTSNFGEDIYVFTTTHGLFGGFSLDGTMVVPMPSWNEALYGRPVTPQEIVQGTVANPASQPLRDALANF